MPTNNKQKLPERFFQNAPKLQLYENFNKFPGMHGPGLPIDGFVHKLIQINST